VRCPWPGSLHRLHRRLPALCLVAVTLVVASCSSPSIEADLYRAPAVPNVVDDVVFEAGNWEPHLAAGSKGTSWGNHRAVVEVDGTAMTSDAVVVTIPWRRHDPDPAAKAVVVVDAASGERIDDVIGVRVEQASGDVVFRPVPGASTYHVYYMPWQSTGGYYPTVTYPSSLGEPDPAWASAVRGRGLESLPRARTTRIQSVDDFHSFFPMEVIATEDEAARFVDAAGGGWTVVPEHRDYPVRMRHFLPKHWVDRGPTATFESRVLRDEYLTFQIGVVAASADLDDVRVRFDRFPASWMDTLTCFNCGGIDETGRAFEKTISVPAGEVQPLWIGVLVPEGQPSGPVEGEVIVSTAAAVERAVHVRLDVDEAVARNHGFDEPELMSRLAWLNSTAGTDPDFLIDPYTPVEVDGRALSILGRRIELGASGLPDRILSYFTPELTRRADEPEDVLARPLRLDIVVDGGAEALVPADLMVRSESLGRASWSVESRSSRLRVRVDGALEYDGMLDYQIDVEALEPVEIDDIVLPVVLVPDAATYMLGLGRPGGKRPDRVDWRWAVENHQEGVWLGGIHKGLQYVLRDDNYERPLNTNFYQDKPLNLPPSWYNGGRGGIRIETAPAEVRATNYSGPRSVAAGEVLHFNVRFLLTPFKPVDTRTHFNTRFVHKYVPVDEVRAAGGTVVNIHHANEINPYINYPFFNLDLQTAYIEEAHRKGIKVKLYNTIRELTYRAHELFALRSLGDEILNDGEGGGHSWMQEHLENRYHSAWHAWRVDDAAMLDKGTSRWTNYYIEGLAWLAEHQHIDGLYLDDIAFSRETVKRMISVLDAHRDEVVIDLHSANQFNPRDGHINSAMLYMEHFPFLSRLWFGEYFDYDLDADYWLTEVSGLPFGLMGEMLQDGGHPYRGLLFGMTARLYGDVDPRPVWALMNDFGIADSRMIGYWLESAPVRVDHPRILATTYLRPEGALVALASWSGRDETVALDLDLDALGLPADVRVWTPAVEGLQEEADVDPSAVLVPANQGLFLRLASSGDRH